MVFDVEAATATVLVVDDEEVVREVLEQAITEAGHQVLLAKSSAEALALLDAHSVGVAIVDKNLGVGESGVELLHVISKRSPYTQSILITGYATTESAVLALREGALDYIIKPFDIEQIVQQVERGFTHMRGEFEADQYLDRHEMLFETVPGLVWFMTDQGRFKRINRHGASLLGYDADELAEQTVECLLPEGGDAEDVYWAFSERRTGERATRHRIVELVTKSGERRQFEVFASGAYRRGPGERQFLGTIGVALDVTDRQRLTRAMHEADKMQALGRLAGGIAHDFNNMLAVVVASAQSARRSFASPDDIPEELADIEAASARAKDLVKQLLAFSRKETGSPIPVDLGQLVQQMQSLITRLVGTDVEVVSRLDTGLGTTVVDPVLIERALMNLAANARDAMPRGGELVISTSNVDFDEEYAVELGSIRPGRYVVLRVSDNGRGMSKEVQKHIFEPFYSTKEEAEGAGLGLAMVYGIVTQSDGGITVQSSPDVGTVVSLFLPRSDRLPPERKRSRVEAPAWILGATVLMVEDDLLVRRAASRLMKRAKIDVIEASDAAEAMEVMKSRGADVQLLITDLIMPVTSGAELARAIRTEYPDLPVVYVSGYTGDLLSGQQLLKDRATLLRKPFSYDDLMASIAKVSKDG